MIDQEIAKIAYERIRIEIGEQSSRLGSEIAKRHGCQAYTVDSLCLSIQKTWVSGLHS